MEHPNRRTTAPLPVGVAPASAPTLTLIHNADAQRCQDCGRDDVEICHDDARGVWSCLTCYSRASQLLECIGAVRAELEDIERTLSHGGATRHEIPF